MITIKRRGARINLAQAERSSYAVYNRGDGLICGFTVNGDKGVYDVRITQIELVELLQSWERSMNHDFNDTIGVKLPAEDDETDTGGWQPFAHDATEREKK